MHEANTALELKDKELEMKEADLKIEEAKVRRKRPKTRNLNYVWHDNERRTTA